MAVHPKKSHSELTKNWPKEVQLQIKETVGKYGEPHEVTNSMLIWYNNGPWNRTIIYKKIVQHNWPLPHVDVLEQAISYKVPLDKFDDLAKYDGSVWAERTKGELIARCHFESMNFVALNLAHDVIRGNKTPQKARKAYEELFKQVVINKQKPSISTGLRFAKQSERVARDSDKITLDKQGDPKNPKNEKALIHSSMPRSAHKPKY